MRCRTCDYPLWNIPPGQCPECGTPFKPSDFDFNPNTVRFCCPHCNQQYFGTDQRGHLEPAEFDCVNCHNHIHIDQTILLPADGVKELDTEGTRPLGWTDPNRKSWRYAFYNTLALSLGAPIPLVRRLPAAPKPGAAIGFAATMALIPSLLGLAIIAFFVFAAGPSAIFALTPFFLTFFAIAAAYTLIAAPVQHLLLKATGGTKHHIGATIESAGFTSAPLVICAVPCLGAYFLPLSILWWSINQSIFLKHRQATGWARAFIIGLLPAATALVIAIVAIIGFFRMTQQFTNTINTINTIGSTHANAIDMRTNLEDWAQNNDGTGPDNALLLLTDGIALAGEFYDATQRQLHNINPRPDFRIANLSLANLELPSSRQRSRALNALDQHRPPNPAAQRIGDVVFTHFNITIDQAYRPTTSSAVIEQNPGDLWLFIIAPETATLRPPHPTDDITIVTNTWELTYTYNTLITALLPAQNTLRATYNLPPIPDPATIPHAHWADANGNTFGP